MANNSYNLRGIEVNIQDTNGVKHYHYVFFIDLDPTKVTAELPAINWQYDEPSFNGTFYTGTFPPPPTNNAKVRTYYIGMCTLPNSGQVIPSSATANLSQDSGPSIAVGNPCTRRPPIVRIDSTNTPMGTYNGFAIGLQSQLGDLTIGATKTIHSTPDFFAVICGSVPPQFGNTMINITLSDNKIICEPTQVKNISNDGSNVVAVGVFDCNISNFSITSGYPKGFLKNSNLPPTIPTAFKIKTPAIQASNIQEHTSPEISIFWSQF